MSADFSGAAPGYLKKSKVQSVAAERLLELLDLGPEEDVLDLGCGPGHLTARLREQTRGRVVGADASAAMIAAARQAHPELEFRECPAHRVGEFGAFDAVFCNSAFQWFKPPGPALSGIHAALKPGGRIAIQAPARSHFCPNFVEAVAGVAGNSRTGPRFRGFRSPWLVRESADGYRVLFEDAGFRVAFAELVRTVTHHTVDEAFGVFESGAQNGYLDPGNYPAPPPEGYREAFRKIVRETLGRQAGPDGRVELVLHRIYLVAVRPG